jgi:hypothetical protein
MNEEHEEGNGEDESAACDGNAGNGTFRERGVR